MCFCLSFLLAHLRKKSLLARALLMMVDSIRDKCRLENRKARAVLSLRMVTYLKANMSRANVRDKASILFQMVRNTKESGFKISSMALALSGL